MVGCLVLFFFLMIRRPPRATRLTHSFPTRRSSDLLHPHKNQYFVLSTRACHTSGESQAWIRCCASHRHGRTRAGSGLPGCRRSEEHTSELQSLMRISYAVFCLKKKNTTPQHTTQPLTPTSPTTSYHTTNSNQ